MYRDRVKQIAEVCIALRKMADYLLNNEPENLTAEDFDRMAVDLEGVARTVDGFLDDNQDEGGD